MNYLFCVFYQSGDTSSDSLPAFVRIVTRGAVADLRSDVSSLELFSVSLFPFLFIPMQNNCFGGILESACLSVHLVATCAQITCFCQSTGRDTESHLVTAIVFLALNIEIDLAHFFFFKMKVSVK